MSVLTTQFLNALFFQEEEYQLVAAVASLSRTKQLLMPLAIGDLSS